MRPAFSPNPGPIQKTSRTVADPGEAGPATELNPPRPLHPALPAGPQACPPHPESLGLPEKPPHELAKKSLSPYVIEPPDVLLVESTQNLRDQPVRGQHLVRPDGTIGLGIYGSVAVGGMTLEQAKVAISSLLSTRIRNFDPNNLYVDVLTYNSKFYYIITDGGGYGEQVVRLPFTGSETVLDGIAQIYGLPPVASKGKVWVARRSPTCLAGQVLPVDWVGITQKGLVDTNYQVMPGDRIYVKADKWISFDAFLAKRFAPLERILGVTLLGSTTVNSIMGRSVSGGR